MTEAEWLACDDPRQMLDEHQWQLPPRPAFTARKLRLLACALIRAAGDRLAPEARRNADILEALADGMTGYHALASIDPAELARSSLRVLGWTTDPSVPPAAQAALLRDLFGNPFRPVAMVRLGITHWHVAPDAHMVSPPWMEWNDGTVPRLAQAIYDERRFEDMPILADALEDAGCADADILDHCRGPWPHARGCWVVDLLLGKE
jgi:hypothetical protein